MSLLCFPFWVKETWFQLYGKVLSSQSLNLCQHISSGIYHAVIVMSSFYFFKCQSYTHLSIQSYKNENIYAKFYSSKKKKTTLNPNNLVLFVDPALINI